jgi:transposase
MEKNDLRTACKEVKEDVRKRAIRMLQQDKRQKEVALLLGVNKNSVNIWHMNYKKYGSKSFKEKPRGHKQGDGRLLTPKQEKQVQRMIIDKMPEQLKLPFALWTRRAIKDLIKRQYGITIAIRTMGDYLHRWGFTPQKPEKRAYEQNPKAVAKWLKNEYPTIKKKAKQDNAEIHWGDETGVRNDCQYGRSYAPEGKTPTITKMAKRISLNMISTVTNQGKVRFMTYNGTMNSAMLIKFLKRLTKEKKRKIYLILDNLKVHHSKPVKEWADDNKEKIILYFLPSYSPERNPDEYLNCDLKYGLAQKVSPKNVEHLRKNVQSHMKLLQKKPDRVAKYFKHESIKYAAA